MIAVPFDLTEFFAAPPLPRPVQPLIIDQDYIVWSTGPDPAPIGFCGISEITPPTTPQPQDERASPPTTPQSATADPFTRLAQQLSPELERPLTDKELIGQFHILMLMEAEVNSYN